VAGRPRIGLALGVGGARGWCHLGAIRALETLGVRADVVAGSSMGALVGAALAAGRLDALADWALGLTWKGALSLVDVRLTGGGLVKGAEVVSVLETLGIDCPIQSLGLPFLAVAADLSTGREVWLTEGAVAQAVRASIALPGLFSPWCVDGRWLVDGGVVNPVPVLPARALGAEVVIAIVPNARPDNLFWVPGAPSRARMALSEILPAMPESLRNLWGRLRHAGQGAEEEADPDPPPYVDTVIAAIDIMSDTIRRTRLAAEAPDIVLEADLGHITTVELHRAAEAIAEGERIVMAQADRILACTQGAA
jgi:NTE family protein